MKNEPKELRVLRLSLTERNNDLISSMTGLKKTLESIHNSATMKDVQRFGHHTCLRAMAEIIIPALDDYQKELAQYDQLLSDFVETEKNSVVQVLI